jgi:hypothetical protein
VVWKQRTRSSRNVLRALMAERSHRNGGACALMKVLIGVDPHKASLAVAIDEAEGELLERASFPQNRTGLRALERWARRFPERRPKRWRTPADSVSTWRGG